MIIEPACGGQVRITADGYMEGAPELVVEISSSSVSIDLNAIFRAYQRNGVREYIVWQVRDELISWFALRSGDLAKLSPDSHGIIRSVVFPALWLDTVAALRMDPAGIHRILQAGVATKEHAEFASLLQTRRNPD